MKLSFSGSGDLARGGFDLWDVRAVAGSVLGFLQRQVRGRRAAGGRHGARSRMRAVRSLLLLPFCISAWHSLAAPRLENTGMQSL
jgi:hypothetical protein